MNRAALLAAYDAELRRDLPYFDASVQVENDGPIVRLIGPTNDAGNNSVLFAELNEKNAGEQIDRQVAHFSKLGKHFEWKWHGHDRPEGLDRLLAARGFARGEEEWVLARAIAQRPAAPPLPEGYAVGEWPRDRDLSALMAVQSAVWAGEDLGWLVDSLARERAAAPEKILFHAVTHRGTPVSLGWTRYHGRFASLFGGSTLSEHRGRGLYRALLAYRLEEAARRAASWALVDAGPMSRPILERLGFERLTPTIPFVYPPQK